MVLAAARARRVALEAAVADAIEADVAVIDGGVEGSGCGDGTATGRDALTSELVSWALLSGRPLRRPR